MSAPQLTNISGIGPSTAALLQEHGFNSPKDIAEASVKSICEVPGFGPARAKAVKAAAKRVSESEATGNPMAVMDELPKLYKPKKPSKKKEKKKDKPKKSKKSKKDKKKKVEKKKKGNKKSKKAKKKKAQKKGKKKSKK